MDGRSALCYRMTLSPQAPPLLLSSLPAAYPPTSSECRGHCTFEIIVRCIKNDYFVRIREGDRDKAGRVFCKSLITPPLSAAAGVMHRRRARHAAPDPVLFHRRIAVLFS
ncbi:hypothetical protein EVAR_93335_1 [Eumeta japonica]|uniref:Uncharacterized protein n=1 Tax=Eumeta variegata TaxID=151549 RepID=A0A4C1USX1_EUMVA|nr:hypothetical protein EVAR_93335_1 [Eumeta japonica]